MSSIISRRSFLNSDPDNPSFFVFVFFCLYLLKSSEFQLKSWDRFFHPAMSTRSRGFNTWEVLFRRNQSATVTVVHFKSHCCWKLNRKSQIIIFCFQMWRRRWPCKKKTQSQWSLAFVSWLIMAKQCCHSLTFIIICKCLEQHKTTSNQHGKFIVPSKKLQKKLPSCQNIVLSGSTMAFNKLNWTTCSNEIWRNNLQLTWQQF